MTSDNSRHTQHFVDNWAVGEVHELGCILHRMLRLGVGRIRMTYRPEDTEVEWRLTQWADPRGSSTTDVQTPIMSGIKVLLHTQPLMTIRRRCEYHIVASFRQTTYAFQFGKLRMHIISQLSPHFQSNHERTYKARCSSNNAAWYSMCSMITWGGTKALFAPSRYCNSSGKLISHCWRFFSSWSNHARLFTPSSNSLTG